MSVRSRAGILLATAGLALAGCTTAPPGPEPVPTPAATSSAALARQKKAAQIADCPASSADTAPVGNGLPDLVLECLGGGRSVHLAGLRGKPMLINIWAQWCSPCREEAPALTEIAGLDQSELLILGVDFNDPRPDDALLFAQLSKWRYPQLVDADKALGAPLQLLGPPLTLLVRADGTIVARHIGPFRSADEIRQQVKSHLGVTL